MALGREHEIHQRRLSRNVGVGIVLGAFVVLLFGLTIVKMQNGASMEAFDHTARPGLVSEDN